MRRFAAVLAAAAALFASASAVEARTFTVVPATSEDLPSYVQPNAPGAITVPFALSTPPARPAVLSYSELVALWGRAGAAYGIPWQVLAAINKIESNFGQNMGPSSAGAVGWMQFMPSTWARWGMDADRDGLADPWDPEDAVFAAARYLAAAGAHEDLARGIFAYNHAQWYVDDVLELAAQVDSGDGGFAAALGSSAATFQLSALQAQLADARRAVTRAQGGVPGAERVAERLEHKKLVLARRAGNPRLPVRKFEELEARITRIERVQDRIAAALDRRHAELDAAVGALESLEDQIASAAVASPAAAVSGTPGAVDGYVFPVGGGPTVVSVGHDHHDYPAADIAAPEGSPLYALADSIVTESYREGNGKCGIGLKLRLSTGAVFVYCHLSYLEPGIVPGAALAAGAPVGLVGSTGNSTGPHLHLAYDPALSYPQNEAWFEAFAGVAFRWQDAPTPEVAPEPGSVAATGDPAPGGERVFSVVSRTSAPAGSRVVTFTR